MIQESLSRQDLSPADRRGTSRTAASQDAAPPVITGPCRGLILPLASVGGLALLVTCVAIGVKWNVPLPRCVFKTVTGLPCFTCGATRALAALGRFEVWEAFKFNPLITLACATLPVWLGIALLKAAFGAQLRPRIRLTPKTILLLLAAASILNWMYLLLQLPK